jgi:hypothetical protein
VPSTTISEISSLLEPPAGETMKRAAPEDNSANYHYSKQARFDNPQQPYQQPAYGFQQQPFGNEYYPQQQPGNWQP